MNFPKPMASPKNESELLARCAGIEGLSFSQLASALQFSLPLEPVRRKGWAGQAIEIILGASSGSLSLPDFNHLDIELKTIPFNNNGKPRESTFITYIPLLEIHRQTWLTSACRRKLGKILWIPVEGSRDIPFEHRRIGRACLWSPSEEEEAVFRSDWEMLTTMISTGQLEEIDARMGKYLQIRPKAANSRAVCFGFDSAGHKIQTLPRGFYLRSSFTAKIFNF